MVRVKKRIVSPRYSKSFIDASNWTLVYTVAGQYGVKEDEKRVKKV